MVTDLPWPPPCLDLREATRTAVRSMIAVLEADHGLSREEAYMLTSVAGDLRLHEVVRSLRYCGQDYGPKLMYFQRSTGRHAQLCGKVLLSCPVF